MSPKFGGLWRHRDFLKLWSGQTVSMFGSMAGRFALSLVAVIVLHATPVEIAILNGCSLVPQLLVGLFAGVWVDRLHRRPILICADISRAAVMGYVPTAALLHVLTIEGLYAVTVLISVLTVFFDVAYVSYLPALVGHAALVEGNSKLEASAAVAEAGGFGLGGVLVQALTAPVAVLVDAVSFALSALSIALIRSREATSPAASGAALDDVVGQQRRLWHEVREGLGFVARSPIQRAIAGASWIGGLFGTMTGVVIMLFFVHDLHLQPALMGPLFGLGGVAAFFGAIAAPGVARRWGLGRSLIGMLLLCSLGSLFTAAATGPMVIAVAMLAVQQMLGDSTATIYNINHVTLLQSSTPDRLQGRVNATIRFVETAAMIGGLILGGVLGEVIGLRPTLFVAAFGGFLAPIWYVFSPVRALRTHPVEARLEVARGV